jgi:hypothetical protein
VGTLTGFPDHFFDLVSMVEAIQDASKSSDKLLAVQAGSIKAGHKGLGASRMLNSFSVTIPQVLAKTIDGGTEIYAVTYEKWRSRDGCTGVVEVIRKAMDDWKLRTDAVLGTRYSSHSRQKALMLARNMMNDSINC